MYPAPLSQGHRPQADQLSYYPSSDPALWIGPSQHLYLTYELWWSSWRSWSYRTGAAGSPLLLAIAGYQRVVSVMVHYWWCVRYQKPWIRPRTHCNEHLHIKLFGEKLLSDILQLPVPLLQTNIWWRGVEDGGTESGALEVEIGRTGDLAAVTGVRERCSR